MGTRAAQNDANVYMGRLEDRFVHRTQWYNHTIDWISFINGIFLIWKGDSDSLNTFIEYLNSVVPSIKLTHEISSTSSNFLGYQGHEGQQRQHKHGRLPETNRHATVPTYDVITSTTLKTQHSLYLSAKT